MAVVEKVNCFSWFKSYPGSYILYKRDYASPRSIIKPNTFRWRASYYFNQKFCSILIWITKPLIKKLYSWWRIEEGEESQVIYDYDLSAARTALTIYEVDGFNLAIRTPKWLVGKKDSLKTWFEQKRKYLANTESKDE